MVVSYCSITDTQPLIDKYKWLSVIVVFLSVSWQCALYRSNKTISLRCDPLRGIYVDGPPKLD